MAQAESSDEEYEIELMTAEEDDEYDDNNGAIDVEMMQNGGIIQARGNEPYQYEPLPRPRQNDAQELPAVPQNEGFYAGRKENTEW